MCEPKDTHKKVGVGVIEDFPVSLSVTTWVTMNSNYNSHSITFTPEL